LDNPHITLTFAVVVSADDISDDCSNCVTGAPFAAAANDDEDERNDDSHRGFSKIVLLFISFTAAIDDISTNSCAAVKDDDYGIGGYLYQVINDTKQLIALVSSITLDCSR
jgi:hypothetical protein